MKMKRILMTAMTALMFASAMAQRTFDVELWSGKMPNDNGDKQDTAKVRVFLPAEKLNTGRAVVICPGGGYEYLAIHHEGYDWAGWFNEQGIAVIVLKYRMPHGNPKVPLSDAEQAMKLVRQNASAWKIDRENVGIMGFSAGGHLASTVATHSKGEAKPDFQILFYPVITMTEGITHQGSHDNLLGKGSHKKEEQQYSNDLQVTRVTPRAFIALADDDRLVLPANGVNYYVELYRHDIPATLHVFPSGGHGFGMSSAFLHHAELLLELRAWLRSF